MGAHVARQADQISVRSWILKAIGMDLNRIPDAAMTLATLALFAEAPRASEIFITGDQRNRRITASSRIEKSRRQHYNYEHRTITPPAELRHKSPPTVIIGWPCAFRY